MDHSSNSNQPIGNPLPNWRTPKRPSRVVLRGRYGSIEPLMASRHSTHLYEADSLDEHGTSWTYLPYGPFLSLTSYQTWIETTCQGDDPMFFAIVDSLTNKPTGVASYLRVTPESGSIEVGHIHYSPLLQGSKVATEAMYLMMKYIFELGYRRYEWKCDALNAASHAAALRLGFTFEGIFRQATVYRNRNRDTAWFSVTDSEWPRLEVAFKQWLSPSNFDSQGKQIVSLRKLKTT